MATNIVTKSDIDRIEESLKKLVEATKGNRGDRDYLEMLSTLIDSFNKLRLTVEFDHEQRLRAIEDFLQDI
jgi:hypothetical protein